MVGCLSRALRYHYSISPKLTRPGFEPGTYGFRDRRVKPIPPSGESFSQGAILKAKAYGKLINGINLSAPAPIMHQEGVEPSIPQGPGIFLLLYVTIAILKDVVVWTMFSPCHFDLGGWSIVSTLLFLDIIFFH